MMRRERKDVGSPRTYASWVSPSAKREARDDQTKEDDSGYR
jgi:hypothetical protein